ncbi:MAG: DUF5111 domain-containing protein [Bacteroidetes bacterium]|uniref:DUF5111 domain-containing protein n=1 Tax=Candidatus Cryptobacteroides avicola TaxID=2840757 RepID=A0A940DRR4_9BACT|nr:DUF5111 domain-containing protein [Candidatus Cryptobacteroides avicola]
MKLLRYILPALSILLSVSCMKDGEMLTATLEGDGTRIGTADSEIVLDINEPSALALTIWWDRLGNASLSNPDAQVPSDMIINAVQFSTDGDFSTYVEETVDNSASSVQFTAAELNTIMTELGLEGGVAATVYIRMSTSLGTNTEPVYGESIEITVTPYFVDMSFIRLAGVGSGAFTGVERTLPATVEDGGEYAGFADIPAGWWNFFFIEGTGNIWGALTDGANQFYLERKNDISSWNCWFPEPSGCYYITMSTATGEWTAVSVSEVLMSIGGAEPVQMEYSAAHTAYTAVLTTTADNVPVQADLSGILYNTALGQDSAESASMSLTGSSDGTLAAGEAGAVTGINTGAAGTYTLILRLADMTWKLAEGEVDIDAGGEQTEWPDDPDYSAATSEWLYIYGLSDGTPSSVEGRLARTSDGVYEGFFYMTSWFNFKFGDNEDPSAARIYGSAPSSEEGALERLYCGSDMYNIWWDSDQAAYTYLTVNTNDRSWSYTTVTSISIAGDFNGYSLTSDVMTFDPASGTWSAVITPGSWGQYGIQFVLNEEWGFCYAPAEDGTLFRSGNAAMPSTAVEPGVEYEVTIDLNDPAAMTWSIEPYNDSPDPEFSRYLYVFYTWPSEGYWQERLAATLYSAGADGVYRGFFTTGNSWSTPEGYASPYVNYTFSTSPDANSGIKYGVTDNTSLVENGGSNGWVENLGIQELVADLVNMTVSHTHIGQASVVNTVTGVSTPMAFDDTADYVWKATCTFAEGDTFNIVLGDNVYTFGGSEGALSSGNGPIAVPEAGTYLVTADLGDFSSLKYTLTRQ